MSFIAKIVSLLPGRKNAMPSGPGSSASTMAPGAMPGMPVGGRELAGLSNAVNGARPKRSKMLEYDQVLLWIIIALLSLGLIMVYSASIAMPDSPRYSQWSPAHFLIRHLFSLSVAGTAAFIAIRSHRRFSCFRWCC